MDPQPSISRSSTIANLSELQPKVKKDIQWSVPDKVSTNKRGEGSLKHDEFRESDMNEISESSRRTSITLPENHDLDGDETAVNSKAPSKANSVYQPKDLDQETKDVEPYHVFTTRKKKQLVWIVSLAGLFSPLSSNIYFPIIGELSRILHVSYTAVSLSVTIYMIVQAISPSIWGPFSDTLGRRPIFVATMIVYLIANIGLATSDSYITLMIFRGIQAAGSAATISIGSGVIADIADASERGGMIGIFGGLRMMGQALGPVIGGLITSVVGYHGIFWFLFLLGSLVLFLIVALLPETLRPIAGNGTTRLVGFQKPLIYHFKPQSNVLKEQDPDAPKRRVTVRDVFSPLRFLSEIDVFITLFFGSIVYTVWSMITSSTATMLQDRFHLDDFQTGLIFLPNGIGCVVGSTLTGYLMNYDYKRTEKEYRKSKNISEDVKLNAKGEDDFPIEKARLRNVWWIVLVFVIATIFYGFSFRFHHLSVPLILQFFISYTATAVFSLNSTLVVDLYPGKGASATAVNNLMRCSVGAVGVAFVEMIIEAIGAEQTFMILGLCTFAMTPLLVVQWKFGPRWRSERVAKLKAKEEEMKEGEMEMGKIEYSEEKV